MLERLRAALRGRDEVERRLQSLEEAVAQQAHRARQDSRHLDEAVHGAVELNSAVLQRRLDSLTGELEALRAAVRGAREHTEAAVEVSERKLARRMDLVRRAVEASTTPAPHGDHGPERPERPAAELPEAQRPIDAGLYVALEDRFRGEPALIQERQRHYLTYLGTLVDADHPLLDIGCGRGEWLRVLADAEIPAVGVDSNPVAVAECREAGLRVVHADLASELDALPDGSLGAVTMFQVVEHLPFPILVSTMRSVARVLRPGGVLLAETPNALNLRVAASNFWIDPTHERPLHPEVLVFLALETGFAEIDRLFANRIGPETPDLSGLPQPVAEALVRLLEQVDGPGDFCLLARTPGADV